MNCDKCGRTIKRGWEWNGLTLGSGCFRKENPFYSDPAQAVFIAAKSIIKGDKSPLRHLPSDWKKMTKLVKKSQDYTALTGEGNQAYWLAVLTHNAVGRSTPSELWSVGEYARFK